MFSGGQRRIGGRARTEMPKSVSSVNCVFPALALARPKIFVLSFCTHTHTHAQTSLCDVGNFGFLPSSICIRERILFGLLCCREFGCCDVLYIRWLFFFCSFPDYNRGISIHKAFVREYNVGMARVLRMYLSEK